MRKIFYFIYYIVLIYMCVQQSLMCGQKYDETMRIHGMAYVGKGHISYCYDIIGLNMCYDRCLCSEFCSAMEHNKETLLCRFLSMFNKTDTKTSRKTSIILAKDTNVNECTAAACHTLSSSKNICFDLTETCNTTYYLVSGPHGVSDDAVSFSSVLCHTPVCKGFRLDSPTSWLPFNNILGQWIQVVFENLRTVVGIVIQERNIGGQWVVRYHLMYLCGESTHWEYVKDDANLKKTFHGNTVTVRKKITYLDQTIFTKGIRILPTHYYGYTAMRFDVLGC